MNNLKFIPIILFSALFFLSCNGKKSEGKTSEKDSVITTVFKVDDLLASADQLVNKTITVEGECSHLCTHTGKKLFLEGDSEDAMIRAESDKPFRQECINKKVLVTGKLIEEKIDEAYLTNWESELAAKADSLTDEGCTTERRAVGQKEIQSSSDRIADFRTRIAEEEANTGKDYLAFYHIETANYRVVE